MSLKKTFTVFVLASLAGFGAAHADDQSDAVRTLANKLMQTTTMVAVTDVATADKFVPDIDPDTLQIVYLTDPNAGKSHVSDDGEVVFFVGDPPVDSQQPYIFKAFEIRAKLRLAKH
jgi:hypothetical protein